MIWREKERSKIRVMQMNNLRSLLGIRRMEREPNAQFGEMFGVTKGVEERIDESILRWFDHILRTAKRIYVGECVGSRLVRSTTEEVD